MREVLDIKLNGQNTINIWVISIVRYSTPFLDWKTQEVKELNRHTRKLLIIHKALYPKSNEHQLYVSRNTGGSNGDMIETSNNGLESRLKESNECSSKFRHGSKENSDEIKASQSKNKREPEGESTAWPVY